MRLLILFLLASSLYAETLFFNRDKKKSVVFVVVNGVRVSEGKNSSAYKISLTEKFNLKKITSDSRGSNPTSNLCLQILGLPRIFYQADLSEVSICEFNDGSTLFTWDLLNKISQH